MIQSRTECKKLIGLVTSSLSDCNRGELQRERERDENESYSSKWWVFKNLYHVRALIANTKVTLHLIGQE